LDGRRLLCTLVHMRRAVGFEWDERKARANLRKHRVDFADAATVFEDDRALTVANDDPEKEHYVTIGMDALGRVLVVVYTMRGERIISARQATRRERAEHEQGL
jgi:uncharacterized DUF497 family protein